MGFPQADSKKGIRRFWPVFGFLMLIALAAIAYVLAPAAMDVTKRIIPQFRGTELPKIQMQWIFTGVVFVVLGLIAAGIIALTAPRSKMQVKETDLMKEREAMLRERQMQKKRQQDINRKMRNQ